MFSDESILHYIWKCKLFPVKDLRLKSGESLKIIRVGQQNDDAGPDFYESRIRIGKTLWAGSVEIHINASDWIKHHHQKDKAYDNVILHVVWNDDKKIFRTDGTLVPALELKSLINKDILEKIERLKDNNSSIPCKKEIHKVDKFTYRNWLDRVLVERLDYKIAHIKRLFDGNKGSWEDTFHILLARNFGFKINQQPFEMLARNLPQRLFGHHKSNLRQIEALVFGVAGFLDKEFIDTYPDSLKKEFEFLKRKYRLTTLDKFIWKFSKTRPDNFPTIRLAQFAALIHRSSHLFSKLLESREIDDYKAFFSNLEINNYWFYNYDFEKERKRETLVKIGAGSVDNLLINSIVPMLFFYGNYMQRDLFKSRALNILEKLKAEENSPVNNFRKLGLEIVSAADSQGILHLKNFYCNQKKCLNCAIGAKILNLKR
ncbi:hypothetical protein Pedsa_2098 [Pseudopedobacter saltans DSM 12145]|uniref:DUF2851 domain-containing protein n=1 Tax=Pseudopedobacter saltans (strain ATCC 51119 / DSM 12145 / JCM 21818 / CCUG 39354 / LMG 10337 / NBRC 100064 / NCIMB 13643) TaxID=762903 RepID=F0SB15_PSESL|nr:DUF2851 family protein [Pseudopedobacter saltans]ADY52650.1 hypothetical protein Pedsa_2098 [Pseudopedobacter saltans DSM 12145]